MAIALHWTIALAIVLQVSLSARMEGRSLEAFAVTQLHKSVGITILLLSLVRLAWRLMNPPPPLPSDLARWERVLAHAVHAGLYVIMVGMPLTGWLMVSTSRIEIPTLLYGVVPWPHLPLHGAAWHEAGELGHETLAKLLYGLAALHVAGALKHQLFSRDEPVLPRMLPGARGRWLDPRLAAVVVAALAVFAFGRLVQPPHPGVAPPAAPPPAAEPVEAVAPPPASPANAAAGPAATASAAPARWRVQPGSTLGFTTAWSGTPIQGRFERWRAGIVFSPHALEKSGVTVVVELASANTGDRQRDEALRAPDWFDTGSHSEAVFRSTRIRHVSGDRYVAEGTLELRGVKQKLDLPFRLTIDGAKARVRATASLDRTAFGVGQGEFKATDDVPAKVGVVVELHALRDER